MIRFLCKMELSKSKEIEFLGIRHTKTVSPLEFPTNYAIIDQLERLTLSTQYENLIKPNKANYFRLKNFENAIEKIRSIDFEITNSDQMRQIGLGPGLVKRIDEILKSGKLQEITTDPKYLEQMKTVQELTKIPGIGWVRAYEIVKQYWIFGSRTSDEIIKDLKEYHVNSLPWESRLGLKYWNDIQKRIPRNEIDLIKYQISQLERIQLIEFVICGSYRRGLPDSGDIDILLIVPTTRSEKFFRYGTIEQTIKSIMLDIVQEMVIKKYIVDHISGLTNTSYRGYYKTAPHLPARRLDLVIVPESSRIPALVYFTGPAKLNKEMRLKALRKGYRLSSTGLYDRVTDKLVKTFTSEQELFAFLDMEWLEPRDRSS